MTIISNAGLRAPVHVRFSAPGTGIPASHGCGEINFDDFNVGVILAQGDLVLTGDSVFSGFIYASGTVRIQGNFAIRGGIFSAGVLGQRGAANSVNATGTMRFCAGGEAPVPVSPQFFDFRTVSWQEVPLNQR